MREMTAQEVLDSPTPGWLERHAGNPIVTRHDIGGGSSCVYNPAVVKYQGRYVALLRNDIGQWGRKNFDHTDLNLAWSEDGVKWDIGRPTFEYGTDEINDTYDPRLTVMDDGKAYLAFAADGKHGYQAGMARTEDFAKWEVFGLSTPDNRDVVLFPRKFNGRFVRLERPMPVYSRHAQRHDIWSGESADLEYWGKHRLVLAVEQVPYANQKIGAGCPPLWTKHGWLHIFHAVHHDERRGRNGWEEKWQSIYTAGVMLTDLDDPLKVIAVSKRPVITPEAPYETSEGYRNYVVFPTAAIVEDDGEVKIYYGAADSFVCLARAEVGRLVEFAKS